MGSEGRRLEGGRHTMTEQTKLKRFEQTQLAVFKKLSELIAQKKELESIEKELKESIQSAMEHYGVQSFKNDLITLSYVPAAAGMPTIDLKGLQAAEPELFEELYNDYPGITGKKSAYVRFIVR